jgi:hypothetical protein
MIEIESAAAFVSAGAATFASVRAILLGSYADHQREKIHHRCAECAAIGYKHLVQCFSGYSPATHSE